MCDFTGTCCAFLFRFSIDKASAIQKYFNDVCKETSYSGLLIVRSTIAFNHSSGVGSEHIWYVKARLLSGEVRKGSVSDETAPSVDNLDVSKDKKCQDPKLNHDLSEKSEACISKMEIESSEDN